MRARPYPIKRTTIKQSSSFVVTHFPQQQVVFGDQTVTNIYNKSWNKWNYFSSRLDLSYPLRRSQLPGQRFDKSGCRHMKLIEGKYFHQNPNSFYTKHSSTHLLYPHITFLWHTYYFSFHMHSPIICIIICSGRIIIDIIILWNDPQFTSVF